MKEGRDKEGQSEGKNTEQQIAQRTGNLKKKCRRDGMAKKRTHFIERAEGEERGMIKEGRK